MADLQITESGGTITLTFTGDNFSNVAAALFAGVFTTAPDDLSGWDSVSLNNTQQDWGSFNANVFSNAGATLNAAGGSSRTITWVPNLNFGTVTVPTTGDFYANATALTNFALNDSGSGGSVNFVDPSVANWELNLTDETIVLMGLSVDVASTADIDVTAITINSEAAASPSASYTLTDSVVQTVFPGGATISISATDLAALVADTGLAISQATSFLSHTDALYTGALARTSTDGLQVGAYTAATAPANTAEADHETLPGVAAISVHVPQGQTGTFAITGKTPHGTGAQSGERLYVVARDAGTGLNSAYYEIDIRGNLGTVTGTLPTLTPNATTHIYLLNEADSALAVNVRVTLSDGEVANTPIKIARGKRFDSHTR